MRSDSFVREKKIHCGKNYLEVDIINYTGAQIATNRLARARRYRETGASQACLNDKNSKRYFCQLVNSNFKTGDYHITLTYSRDFLPESEAHAREMARRYLRRLSYRVKKKQGNLKYVLVSSTVNARSGEVVRVHHHILLSSSCALAREEIENAWRMPVKKGQKAGEKLGFCNCDIIDASRSCSLNSLASYLCRQGSGKKRWTSSLGLVKPYSTLNDDKYSKRELERYAKERRGDIAFWERRYPGWRILDIDYGIRCEYSEVSGWGIYLQMVKVEHITG